MSGDITTISTEIQNIYDYAVNRNYDEVHKSDILPMAVTITAVALLIITVVSIASLTSGGSIGVVAVVCSGPTLLAGGLDVALGLSYLSHETCKRKAHERTEELKTELEKFSSNKNYSALKGKLEEILPSKMS